VDEFPASCVDGAEGFIMPRIVVSLAALSLLAAPALGQEVVGPNDGKWGAIAYGGPEQASGTAVDFPSAEAARQAAFENCGGRCPRSIVFLRTCGAVAEGPAGIAWASNRWRGRAISRALTQCARSGPGCTVIAWACTTH
jgi:hypothetical protein